jgi:hypothetical protein
MIYYFLHSQFYFLVLVLMVAGPILSAMSVWVLRHYLQVEIHHAQDSYGVQGETAYFTIQIKNPTWFVSLDTKLIVNVENTLMETIGQQVFSVPVHCGKDWSSHHQHKHQKIKLAMQKIVDHPIYKEQ